MFEPNQPVICIKDDWEDEFRDDKLPIKDRIYTVREIIKYPNEKMGLRFWEIINKPKRRGMRFFELSFNSTWFKPLEKRSIKVFEDILYDPKKKIIAEEGPLRKKRKRVSKSANTGLNN